jgi:ATP-binding cassette subfamily F protein 3
MAILSAKNLAQSFGALDLFSDVSLQIADKDRVGLVGPNGVGKTSLLRILAGLAEPTAGIIHRARDLKLGYLRQEAVLTFAGQNNTVYEEMLTVFAQVRQMEAALHQMEAMMAEGNTDKSLFDRYGRLQELYEHEGGYDYQVDIKRVLLGLGFPQEEWSTPLTHLSGGQKTRLLLGRLLLEKPDLLILDEPTNHLDVAAVEWLEQTLRQWPGALIIVSHDRYFLDKIITHTWEMLPGRFKSFRGNYSSYVRQREEELAREQQLFETEIARLTQEIDFVRKHIAGGKTDIAKGKLKRLTRDIVLLEQAEAGASLDELQAKSWLEVGGRVRTISVNEAERRLRAVKAPSDRLPKLNIKLEAEERSMRTVLRTKKLEIGYPGAPLFTCDDLKLLRYDCAALIGPNGCGKTTFLRTIMGEIEPLKGELMPGDQLHIGYFAQAHDQLNHENRVIDELRSASESAYKNINEQEARNYLAQYLFRGDDVFKQISQLSGGERGRLALSILALTGANYLLLDEPTNHLDIQSQEILQTVLEQFDGTIVMVSHDRYLVDRLATQIWEIRDGHLVVYNGRYADYQLSRAAEKARLEAEATAKAADWTPSPLETSSAEQPTPLTLEWIDELVDPAQVEKERKQAKKSKTRSLAQLIDEIEDAEDQLEQIQRELAAAQAVGDEAEITRLEAEQAETQITFDELIAVWEEMGNRWAG